MRLKPAPALVERFAADLGRLAEPGERLAIAVSGGPDSVALLLLAAAARPAGIEAATVDHRLREGSDAEARAVAALCAKLGVPHAVLAAAWDSPPRSAIQERARDERYRLLGRWASERGLGAIATAHQLDDQAETLLMRLARGAGVRGLAGIRPAAPLPGGGPRLIRPLLGWSRAELAAVCADAGVEPARDPANADERFERVRVRKALEEAGWLLPGAVARSASHLAEADCALDWAAGQAWKSDVRPEGAGIAYRPGAAPAEIRRRIVALAIAELASEGGGAPLEGREAGRLLETLEAGGTATLRGVRCSGGRTWRFDPAPPRRP